MTPPVDEVEEASQRNVPPPRDRRQRAGRILLIGVLLYLLVSNVWTQVTADEATQEKEAVQEQAKDAVNPVDQLCDEGGVIAEELNRRGACEKAREVLDAPEPPPSDLGPSREDIAAAVADYLRDNPPPDGRPPTVGEITSAVASYLTEHPPAPGRAPTPTEIATAVSEYLLANPPPPGADGVDGRDAPPPTPEQIALAVNEWLQANPPPAGPEGPQGPPGPVCPEGYELRQVVATTGGGAYTDAVQCVRPDSFEPDPGGLLPPN